MSSKIVSWGSRIALISIVGLLRTPSSAPVAPDRGRRRSSSIVLKRPHHAQTGPALTSGSGEVLLRPLCGVRELLFYTATRSIRDGNGPDDHPEMTPPTRSRHWLPVTSHYTPTAVSPCTSKRTPKKVPVNEKPGNHTVVSDSLFSRISRDFRGHWVSLVIPTTLCLVDPPGR